MLFHKSVYTIISESGLHPVYLKKLLLYLDALYNWI